MTIVKVCGGTRAVLSVISHGAPATTGNDRCMAFLRMRSGRAAAQSRQQQSITGPLTTTGPAVARQLAAARTIAGTRAGARTRPAPDSDPQLF